MQDEMIIGYGLILGDVEYMNSKTWKFGLEDGHSPLAIA
jgi:hypothetical protein